MATGGTWKKAGAKFRVAKFAADECQRISKKRRLKEARQYAANVFEINERTLDIAQQQGLDLPTVVQEKQDVLKDIEDNTQRETTISMSVLNAKKPKRSKIVRHKAVLDNIEREKQANVIRRMVLPYKKKRALRDYIVGTPSFETRRCWSISCTNTKATLHRWWIIGSKKLDELKEFLALWTNPLKTIEGQFGGGVLMYFRFLRWLFAVNCVLGMIVLLFIVIPQVTLPTDLTTSNSTFCSRLYVVKKPENAYSTQPVIDFLQGTGWMEKTIAFYGKYRDNRVIVSRPSQSYNLPLAYVLIILVCFFLSLVLVVKKAGNGIRDKLMGTESNKYPYIRLVFTAWDYRLTNYDNTALLSTNIYREFKCDMEEDMRAAERQNRSRLRSFRLWTLRVILNVIDIAILASACYAIYKVITETTKMKKDADFENKTPIHQLLLSFMTSITITGLNSFVPIIFKKVVKWENYSFAVEVNVTLFRTVFLKLASLIVLVYTIYVKIECSPKDECHVGTGDCSDLRCWETRVGQEFYRLVLVDVFAVIAIVFLFEFPRRLFVIKVKCSIAEMIRLPEFDIPKNILDLIYTEVLVWFGMYFSPLIPLMTALKLYIIFYLKKFSLLHNFVPNEKPYRASDSQFFIQIVLLGSYVVCFMPVVHAIWSMTPSTGCGPFRSHEYVYHVFTATINDWPRWMKGLVNFLTSNTFGIPAFIALLVTIYFMRNVMNTYSHMNKFLRQQLVMEIADTKHCKKMLKDMETKRQTRPPGGHTSTASVVGRAGDRLPDVSE